MTREIIIKKEDLIEDDTCAVVKLYGHEVLKETRLRVYLNGNTKPSEQGIYPDWIAAKEEDVTYERACDSYLEAKHHLRNMAYIEAHKEEFKNAPIPEEVERSECL